jgi:hypothetical protein
MHVSPDCKDHCAESYMSVALLDETVLWVFRTLHLRGRAARSGGVMAATRSLVLLAIVVPQVLSYPSFHPHARPSGRLVLLQAVQLKQSEL